MFPHNHKATTTSLIIIIIHPNHKCQALTNFLMLIRMVAADMLQRYMQTANSRTYPKFLSTTIYQIMCLQSMTFFSTVVFRHTLTSTPAIYTSLPKYLRPLVMVVKLHLCMNCSIISRATTTKLETPKTGNPSTRSTQAKLRRPALRPVEPWCLALAKTAMMVSKRADESVNSRAARVKAKQHRTTINGDFHSKIN